MKIFNVRRMLSSTKVNAFRTFYDSILVVLSSSCRRVAICRIILSEFFFMQKKRRRRKKEEEKKKSKLCALLFSLVSKQLTMISKPRLLAIVVFNIPKQEEQLTKGGRELKISNQLNKKLFLLISINYPLSNLIIKPIEKAIN